MFVCRARFALMCIYTRDVYKAIVWVFLYARVMYMFVRHIYCGTRMYPIENGKRCAYITHFVFGVIDVFMWGTNALDISTVRGFHLL